MQLWGVKKWCSAKVFSDTKQKNTGWKISKVGKILAALQEHIINVKWVEFHETSKVFWAKFYYKKRKLKNVLKKLWNVWTNIKKLYALNWNNIFKKKKRIPSKIFWFWAKLCFLRDCFSQIFLRQPTMVADIFTHPPPPPPPPPLP